MDTSFPRFRGRGGPAPGREVRCKAPARPSSPRLLRGRPLCHAPDRHSPRPAIPPPRIPATPRPRTRELSPAFRRPLPSGTSPGGARAPSALGRHLTPAGTAEGPSGVSGGPTHTHSRCFHTLGTPPRVPPPAQSSLPDGAGGRCTRQSRTGKTHTTHFLSGIYRGCITWVQLRADLRTIGQTPLLHLRRRKRADPGAPHAKMSTTALLFPSHSPSRAGSAGYP